MNFEFEFEFENCPALEYTNNYWQKIIAVKSQKTFVDFQS